MLKSACWQTAEHADVGGRAALYRTVLFDINYTVRADVCFNIYQSYKPQAIAASATGPTTTLHFDL